MKNETLAAVVAVVICLIVYAVYMTKQKQKVEKEAQQLLLAIKAEQSEKELMVNENQHLSKVLASLGLDRDGRRSLL